MRVSNGKETTVNISIDGEELEQVGECCCLGSYVHK